MRKSSKLLIWAQVFCWALASPVLGQQKIYSHGAPSSKEQFMLELINRARANPAAEAQRYGVALNGGLPPGRISTARKQPLAFNRRLIAAARDHSRWMLQTGVFNHTGANGSSPTQRAAARGFPFGAAENIDRGMSTALRSGKVQTGEAHAGLFRSPPHRENLLEPSHSVVGLGMLFGRSGSWHVRRTTQNFSAATTAESGLFIVGVAFSDKNGSKFYDPGEGLRGIKVKPSRGSYYAVTSSSGGFAIPIRPVATRPGIVRVDLPFPASSAGAWQKAQAYEHRFRAEQIRNAPEMTVKLKWSGTAAGLPVVSTVKIKRPELVNYRLTGTDGAFFRRSMITSASVKTDLVMTKGVARAIVR